MALEKVQLLVQPSGQTITAMFNPEEYTINKDNNFATQATGLTVQINNRSTGGTQGWWDFGDGTALEPFDPKLDIIKHAYAKPGTYNVKLTLENLLGEEADRTTPVMLDPDSAPRPEISGLAGFTR